MFQEMMPMSSGGDGNIAASKVKEVRPQDNALWNNPPFKAERVLIVVSYYYNGSGTWYITNFNPTTGAVDNNSSWWSEDGGATWSQNTQYGWTINDSLIEYLNNLSGVATCYCTFVITDKQDIQLES